MYGVSNAYKTQVKAPTREWAIKLSLTLDSGITYNLTEKDIETSTFTFQESSTCGSTIQVGSVYANSLDFSLINSDGKYNNDNFQDATVSAQVGLKLPDGTYEWVPLGTFYVSSTGKKLSTLAINCMDGMYKLNIAGYVIGTVGRLGVVVAGYMGNIPLMLAFTAIAALGMSPLQGDMNALIATTSEYTRLTTGKKVDGTMYSCTSFGTKVGGGLGTAIAGWMLAASGYVQNAATQSQSCVNMLHVMYLWLPMIFNLLITFVLIKLNVEHANKELQKEA